ncbi:ABC transporter ATP-binding protein [Microbacterium sp. 1P10UB]|uniref:ABC transporter ATP-binding protein n=1 Tax=unclassified Microbacterium TaxID=2609290 RepID=UPI0039A362C7
MSGSVGVARLTGAPALVARGLVRRYGDRVAVDHVDAEVGQGEIVALVGPSGCGKSSTLRIIAGLDAAAAGTVDVAGVRVTGGRRPVPPEARGVGMVFQDDALFPHLSVAANVGYGLRRGRSREIVDALLDMLGIASLAARLPHEISGGEAQRAALARTLAARPGLVLLDEPFAHLDASLREQVRGDMIRALRRTGSAALLVTHDQAEALAVADRVLVMRDGRIRQAGTPREVYDRPADAFVAGFIGRSVLLPVQVGAGPSARSALGELAVAPGTPAGERLAVLRPETLALVQPGTGGRSGTVVGASFRGADELLRVRLTPRAGETAGIEVEVTSAAQHGLGDEVAVAAVRPAATVRADGAPDPVGGG